MDLSQKFILFTLFTLFLLFTLFAETPPPRSGVGGQTAARGPCIRLVSGQLPASHSGSQPSREGVSAKSVKSKKSVKSVIFCAKNIGFISKSLILVSKIKENLRKANDFH